MKKNRKRNKNEDTNCKYCRKRKINEKKGWQTRKMKTFMLREVYGEKMRK